MSDDLSALPPLIPREILFGNPTKESPQISPDGTMMAESAYIVPERKSTISMSSNVQRDSLHLETRR